jgi:ATP-dependent helicase/nuclease subunit B
LESNGTAPGVNELIRGLAKFCADHPLDEKILVAPSRVIGRQITDSVAFAMSPGGWINLQAETVGSLAQAVAGEEVAAEARTTLSRAQILAVVERVCEETLDEGSYFGAIRKAPGFHRALARTVEEIRAAGLGTGAITAGSLERAEKAADLRKLLASYESFLAETFEDRPGLLHRAIRRLQSGSREGEAWVLVPGVPEIRGTARDFLKLLGGRRFVTIETDDPENWCRSETTIEFFRALGEENELREVFRRAMASQIPLDQIEVLYTDRASYLSLAYELTQEYGIPTTFVDRINAAYTLPGRAALGFLDWMSSDFEDRKLRSLVVSGAVKLERLPGSDDSIEPESAARILRAAKIGWRRDRYLSCLDSHAEQVRRRRRDPEDEAGSPKEFGKKSAEQLSRIEAVRRTVERFLDAAPIRSNRDRIAPAELARSCAAFVREFSPNRSKLDGDALEAIPRVLDELSLLESEPRPYLDVAARLREAIAQTFVGGSSVTYPSPGRIHFSGFRDGGYSGRAHTFIVGLDESKHPGTGLQDPILLDTERKKVNAASKPREVELRGDAPSEMRNALRACLARLRGAVTLSYSSRELSEGRERYPASALLEIFREVGNPEADQAAMLQSLGEPAGFVPNPARALSASEWWVGRIREAAMRPTDAGAAVGNVYPWLASGELVRKARESTALSVFDGYVPSAGAALDPRDNGEILSASRLEKMADCGLAYFLQYVLKIEEPDELERDEGVWLDQASLGLLLHEVYRRFLSLLREEGLKAVFERDFPKLERIFLESIEEWKRLVPPSGQAPFLRQVAEIRRAGENFLRREEEAVGYSPAYFEVPFGLPERETDCPGAGSEPVEFEIGGGRRVRLRGSIDRVDRLSGGDYAVWDYKTGSSRKFRPDRKLDGGRRLQYALYSIAFDQIVRRAGGRGSVAEAGYSFVGPKESGQRVAFSFDPDELKAVLNALCDRMRGGLFLHGFDRYSCSFCAFESVCGGDSARRRAWEVAHDQANRGMESLLEMSRDARKP